MTVGTTLTNMAWSSTTPVDIKPRSRDVTDGIQKAAARSMLRAVGLTDDDWDKPQIGIASSWNEITPCNMSLKRLTAAAKDGVRRAGGVPLEFGTITVSDGISMGHEGMRASLVSREIIADSVEAVMHGERLDGLVATGGCDKSMPGMMMAIARLNLPGVFVYNGSIMPGYLNGKALDITSVFEAIGACAAGKITEDELYAIEKNACPGEGACGGMFTANTMSSIGEALGLSLPGSASPPAVDRRREDDALRAGEAVVNMLRIGLRPSDILTKGAFENAMALANALGGSTNAVLHLLAIANEAGVELELDDFNKVAARVPHIADTKPGGKFHMSDIDRIGGIPVVLKHLLDEGLLHGDEMTVTGKTMAENLAEIDPPGPDGTVVYPVSNPINAEGGLNVLTGSLAPNGSVVKVAGLSKEQRSFEGVARVFDGEDGAMAAVMAGEIEPGTVIVIRYEGPEGRPRHARDAGDHRSVEGGRARRRLRAHHRRPLLGWYVGVLHRPRRPGGGRRRADRVRSRRRSDPHRRADAVARRARRPVRVGTAPAGLGADPTSLHERRARQVRQTRPGCREGCDHQHRVTHVS